MTSSAFPCAGEMVPQFTLHAQNGQTVRVSDFRGKASLVLIFTAGRSIRLIQELADRAEEIEDENAVVLVINSQPGGLPGAGPSPVSLRCFSDPGALVSRRFGAERQPAVYITDQYGEIYSAHRISEGAVLPSADEALASLRHITAACPE